MIIQKDLCYLPIYEKIYVKHKTITIIWNPRSLTSVDTDIVKGKVKNVNNWGMRKLSLLIVFCRVKPNLDSVRRGQETFVRLV